MKKRKIYFRYFHWSPKIILRNALIILLLITLTNLSLYKSNIKIKSIDTMKYSRDLAREKLNDLSFDPIIQKQVNNIAQTKATYIAIGTPYDMEFLPFLKKWVNAARKNHLKVWFRGNFSGWEQWFNYNAIDNKTHLQMIKKFIESNPDIFENGDIFTPCPECENGKSVNPITNENVQNYRNFLIDEYLISQQAFKKINKEINVGYFSMNYDIAKFVMDPSTTKALGGIVVIDHYVDTPTKLTTDAKLLSYTSKGKVVLGEIGVPIPGINGEMTENQQANWINQSFESVFKSPEIIGINYWTSIGGSTQIWDDKGNPREAVAVIKKFYSSN